MVNLNNANIDELRLPQLAEMQVAVDVLRLDRMHPVISGNKWFKLKYYLQDAITNQHHTLLTFGGAYSNHVIALACATQLSGLSSIGVIRGEESKSLSHTLSAARQYGMQLHFVSRDAYRMKESESLSAQLSEIFGDYYLVPEGGAGEFGRKGSKEILQLAEAANYTHIICALGTGTMFAGITNASSDHQQMIGIPVLKGMNETIEKLPLHFEDPLKIKHCTFFYDFHFGGYAKRNVQLLDFMNRFYQQTGIATDFIYTGKLFYALIQLVEQHYFEKGSKVLAIHSGGLQGNLSLPAGSLLF
jgi:1-aminocyclopropane-1-carboxylate deaminase